MSRPGTADSFDPGRAALTQFSITEPGPRGDRGPQLPQYDDTERRLAGAPAIVVPTITLEGETNRGHNLAQEARWPLPRRSSTSTASNASRFVPPRGGLVRSLLLGGNYASLRARWGALLREPIFEGRDDIS
jgi:hypothetical protein